MKIEFDYESGKACFPAAAAERIGRASDTAVRLLILMAAHPEICTDFDANADAVASRLHCTKKELELALYFWCGAGIADIKENEEKLARDCETETDAVRDTVPETHAASANDTAVKKTTVRADSADKIAGTTDSAVKITLQSDSAAKAFGSADSLTTASAGSVAVSAAPAAVSDASEQTTKDSRRSAKLMREAGLPEYTSEELADMLEKNSGALSFVDEAQRRIGRMLGPREVSILVGLRDYLELDDEYIYLLLDYCAKIDKTSMRYVEKLAFGMYDEGIHDADVLAERLAEREAYTKLEGRFKAMIGARSRKLTTKETRFLNRWSIEMKYDFAMIEAAYEITVDTKHEYNPAYMNGILERWYAAGIFTPEQLDAEKSKKKNDPDFGNSFDTNEFFEAALRRSLNDGDT